MQRIKPDQLKTRKEPEGDRAAPPQQDTPASDSGNPAAPQQSISRRAFTALPLAAGVAFAGTAVLPAAARQSAPSPRHGNRLSAEDRLDIVALMGRYAWLYDCSDADGVALLFTEDAVIHAFGEEVARGRAAIPDFIRSVYQYRGDKSWLHLTDHHQLEGSGDSCTVYSYWAMLEQAPQAEPKIASYGYYVSECRRSQDQWLIAARSINRWNREQLPWG